MGFFKSIAGWKHFRRTVGVILLAFTVFSCTSSFSFLFHWKQDQSLLEASVNFPESMQVANYGGDLGFRWGHVLVGECFGLGTFVLLLILAIWSVKLLLSKKIVWSRNIAACLCSTLLVSLACAYLAYIFGGSLAIAFESGIGGGVGAFVVESMVRLFGPVFTVFIILALALAVVFVLRDGIVKRVEETAEPTVEEEPQQEPEDIEFIEEIPETDEEEEIPEDSAFTPAPQPAVTDVPNVEIVSPVDTLTTTVEQELPQLDIRGDVDRYKFPPPLDLLEDYADKHFSIPQEEIQRNVEKITHTLRMFKIEIQSISASVGYTVTLYKIILADGIKINQVKNIEDDIAVRIGIKGVRVVILPDSVGIEAPNNKPSVVPLKAVLNSDTFRNSKGELPIAIGYTITTKAKVIDLADAPHLLVAGATKQGKSVGLNSIIISLLYSKHPTELKFVFIDPKMVEFHQYGKLLKHYLAVLPAAADSDQEAADAIVKTPKNAEAVLRSLCVEMDERYKLLAEAGVNKVTDYNEKFRNRRLNPQNGHHFMPYLVTVVDEFADLTKSSSDRNLSRSIENSINRLAAKGRAAGLHIIIATQRPSVDVITGTIKGNFPTRMAFRTVQRQDSMTILDMPGAEKLIGRGDMLLMAGAEAERVQCALVESSEIDAVTKFVSEQVGFKQSCGQPYYLPDPGDGGDDQSSGDDGLVDVKNLDSRFEEAAQLAVLNRTISTSMLQRKMSLGFARAGRVMDQLEATGVVGPQQGSRPREALVDDLASLQTLLEPFLK